MKAPRLTVLQSKSAPWASRCAVSCALVAISALNSGSSNEAYASASLRAEQLAIVDCLLPATVRQLGGRMTYLGAREPVKATASECEVRGGEYVAYDRANFATALQVWLPKAKAGDAQAENYVGEIYEKGMGMPSDYAKAAEWYRKAAEQNFVKAQSNLAYLYEQGLGVPKDPIQALNWYRKSSGITDDELTFASEVTAVRTELQGQLDALSAQLEERTRTAEALRQQVDEAREQISQQTARLAAGRRQAEQLKARIAQLQSITATAGPDRTAELQKAQADLKASQQQIEAQESALAALKVASSSEESQLSERLAAAAAEASQLREQLGSKSSEAETTGSQLAAANARLAMLDEQVKRLTADNNDVRTRLQAAKSATASPTVNAAQVEALLQRADASDHAIVLLQATRRQYETQVAELTRAAAANQQQLQASRAEIASLQQRALEAEHQLTEANQRVLEQEQQLALDRERMTAAQKNAEEMRALESSLAEREARLCEERSKVAGLQAEAASYKTEITQLKSQPPAPLPVAAAPPPAPKPAAAADLPPELLGNYYALIIGNNLYQNMPNLSTAVGDAEALAALLQEKYGFKVRILRNATNDEILSAINEYRQTLSPKDNLLIYYAGHGEIADKTFRGYWLPVNAKRGDTTSWISDQMVTEQLMQMSARHVLIMADSCYAGAMTRSGGLRVVAKEGADAEAKRLKYLAGRRSRTVLTSGGVSPVVDGGPGGHSLFAREVIDALQRNSGVLEGAELYNEIFDPIRSNAQRLFQMDQSPVYATIREAGHENGEFLFVPHRT